MNVTYATGNILHANATALVNPVNTVGVMGKGLALEFKRAFPKYYIEYRQACELGVIQVGRVHVYETRVEQPRFIVSFPTKDHWRNPSQIEWIQDGLHDLTERVNALGIPSVAVPALGCGLGGLRWGDVQPLVLAAAARMPGVNVIVFAPAGS